MTKDISIDLNKDLLACCKLRAASRFQNVVSRIAVHSDLITICSEHPLGCSIDNTYHHPCIYLVRSLQVQVSLCIQQFYYKPVMHFRDVLIRICHAPSITDQDLNGIQRVCTQVIFLPTQHIILKPTISGTCASIADSKGDFVQDTRDGDSSSDARAITSAERTGKAVDQLLSLHSLVAEPYIPPTVNSLYSVTLNSNHSLKLNLRRSNFLSPFKTIAKSVNNAQNHGFYGSSITAGIEYGKGEWSVLRCTTRWKASMY